MKKNYPEIKINDDLALQGSPHCWILKKYSTTKDGKRSKQAEQTYHPSIIQASERALQYEAKDCDSLQGVQVAWEKAVNDIKQAILKI